MLPTNQHQRRNGTEHQKPKQAMETTSVAATPVAKKAKMEPEEENSAGSIIAQFKNDAVGFRCRVVYAYRYRCVRACVRAEHRL